MIRRVRILAGAVALLLAACLAAAWLTRDAAPIRTPAQASLVDRRLLDTARQVPGIEVLHGGKTTSRE